MIALLACEGHAWCTGGHVKPWIGIPAIMLGFVVLAALGLLKRRR